VILNTMLVKIICTTKPMTSLFLSNSPRFQTSTPDIAASNVNSYKLLSNVVTHVQLL